MASMLTSMAQSLSYTGTFTDDATKKTVKDAYVEISLSESTHLLRLTVLPAQGAMLSSALVDTVFAKESRYRKADPEDTEFFEERNIFFIYRLTPDEYLDSYMVFSRFIDKAKPELSQIVIRKFDYNGKRLWCVGITADDQRAKEFDRLINTARKKLKFRELRYVNERPGADGKKRRTIFEDDKVVRKEPIGHGNAYNSGW